MKNYISIKGLKFVLLASCFIVFCGTDKSPGAPEENRFVKTVLNQGAFFEPTEMTILPNLDILVTQRRGELMKYDAKTKKVKQVGFLDVYYKATKPSLGNSEEGLLGISADPNFKNNNYIYVYYAPAGDKWIDRLSRFEFKNDTLDAKTEKVILEVKTQREICCHTGGSIAFGKDNLLYVSAGDNSTPFDEPGQKYPTHAFGPMDDRPGHQQYDSRRSAGNTNDLRGKILRIKINEDGTYAIPEGNLFSPGQAKTRPEIYVMGDRNPYRISVDKRTGYLYWGEVGPDATQDSIGTRGARGYDEINQARNAGNFGWPLFVGNNYPYNAHNYDTNEDGPEFDPAKPINNSRNNTGLTELPPAQPAYIWYPYALSDQFPELGTGGRTAMAGPVYYSDNYPVETRYPSYYDGKLFIYDFIRGWIKVVTMKGDGDLAKIEPFMEHTVFHSMIDMETGPDGKIYILEYGNGWFSKNPDAGLSRIDYLSGNRPPAIENLTVNKTSGNLPLTITAKVKAKDPENDAMTYLWTIGSVKKKTSLPSLQYTFTKPGDYNVSVEVADSHKASAKSNEVPVYAGNAQAKINIKFQGNQTFYFPGKPVNYKVSVLDNGEKVDPGNLFIATSYIRGTDMAGASLGHQVISENIAGKNLMMSLDCKACHKINEPSVGPEFEKVAQKYHNDPKADSYLPQKIIKGGSGVWGAVAMPAHPALKESDARQIVHWVLSLADPRMKSLPAAGKIVPPVDIKKDQKSTLAINASYTDHGGSGLKPLSSANAAYLRNSTIDAADLLKTSIFIKVDSAGFISKDVSGSRFLIFPKNKAHLKIEKVDLTGITSLELNGVGNGTAADYIIEIFADRLTGTKIGHGKISFKADNQKATAKVILKKTIDGKLHDVYIVCKQTTAVNTPPLLKSVRFVAAP